MRRRELLGLAGLLALTGCSGSAASGPSAQRTENWSIPDADPTETVNAVGIIDPQTDTIDDVIAAFHQEHPTIKINYQYVPFDSLNSVLDSRITSRTGDPDVFWVDQPRVPALVVRGYLTDLTEQFGPLTDALQEATVSTGSYEDRLYALPLSNSTQLLYYNKQFLQQAGLDEPSTDPDQRISWQDLRPLARQAQNRGGAQHGLLFGQPNRYYQLQPLPVSAGGGDGATGPVRLTPAVDNDGWIAAMDYYGSLFADRITPRGMAPEQVDSTFLAGGTGFLIQGDWMVGKLAESTLDWGVALHPTWEGGKPATPTGSWSVGLNPFSTKKEAASIFLRWLAIDGKGGYSTYRTASELPANSKGLQAHLEESTFTSTPAGRAAAEMIAYETEHTATPRVPTPGYLEFEDIIGRAFSDISNGTDPRVALPSASKQLGTAWQQYQ